MGGKTFLQEGINGPMDKEKTGSETILIQCQDCGHCADLQDPND